MSERNTPRGRTRLEALGKQIDASTSRRKLSKGRSQREATSPQRSLANPRSRPLRRRIRLRRTLVGSLAVVLVLALGGFGYAYYISHDLNRVQVSGLSTNTLVGAEAGSENILMVGSTSRCALKVQNPAYGLCSQGVTGVNSDVMMILHANPTTHQLAVLSIPRDLFVPNARAEGANKIDAGLYQGITQVVTAIQDDLGIPITHAVSVNFDQFANIVDALGGINMSFPVSIFDRESGLNVQAASCVHLNGIQALQVVRARHLQYKTATSGSSAGNWPQENLSDLARIRRNHEFLRVLGSTVAKNGLGNPLSDLSLINSVKSDVTFDQSWSVNDMVNLVLSFHTVNVASVPQLTFPVSVVLDPNGPSGDYLYQGGNYGQVAFPSQQTGQAAINAVLGINNTVNPMSGAPLPAASSINLAVVNGTGIANQAATTGSAFQALGFHVTSLGDTRAVGSVSETVVYYGSHSPEVVAAAEKVLHSITGAVVMGYNPSLVAKGSTITVVTGSQFGVIQPSSAPKAQTAVPTHTSNVPTSSSAIGTPSSVTTSNAPWDPRACTPGSKPTAPVPNRI